MMTPRDFLEAIVMPNVNDFHEDYASMRLAYNAVSATDALAAHIYYWLLTVDPAQVSGSANDSAYRAALASQNDDFALLRDVAKAQKKYVRLTQGNPQILGAEKVASREIGWGEGGFGEGRYGSVKQVVVDLDATTFKYLEAVVDGAVGFLESRMVAAGL